MAPVYVSVFFSFFVSIFAHGTQIDFSASDIRRILLLKCYSLLEVFGAVLGRFSTSALKVKRFYADMWF